MKLTVRIINTLMSQKYLSKKLVPMLKQRALESHDQNAYRTCVGALQGPFPEAEEFMAEDAFSSFFYAAILHDRFPLGEKVISQSREWSHHYVVIVLVGYCGMKENEARAMMERIRAKA